MKGNVLQRTRKATAVAFLVPLFFVWRLFVGERFYAHVPVAPILGELPAWVDAICFGTMVALLVGLSVLRRSSPLLQIFLALSFVFSLWDQSRWMPYFYQFWVMFLVLASTSEEVRDERQGVGRPENPDSEEERVLNSLRAIVLGIWFWSGLHKISAAYIALGYPWMVRPFLPYIPVAYHNAVLATSLLSPLVETGGALLILFPRTRIAGRIVLTGMHLMILLIFGPLGLNWNPSVYSWNIAMIFFIWTFFGDSGAGPRQILLGTGRTLKHLLLHRIVAILFIGMPFFNFFGLWDDFLSHCLYSWTTKEAEVVVTAAAESSLPPEMRQNIRRMNDERIVPVLDWSFRVFESPPYHSYRVFHAIFEKICRETSGGDGITFRIFEKPSILTGHSERISYRCAPEDGPASLREIERLP